MHDKQLLQDEVDELYEKVAKIKKEIDELKVESNRLWNIARDIERTFL